MRKVNQEFDQFRHGGEHLTLNISDKNKINDEEQLEGEDIRAVDESNGMEKDELLDDLMEGGKKNKVKGGSKHLADDD